MAPRSNTFAGVALAPSRTLHRSPFRVTRPHNTLDTIHSRRGPSERCSACTLAANSWWHCCVQKEWYKVGHYRNVGSRLQYEGLYLQESLTCDQTFLTYLGRPYILSRTFQQQTGESRDLILNAKKTKMTGISRVQLILCLAATVAS